MAVEGRPDMCCMAYTNRQNALPGLLDELTERCSVHYFICTSIDRPPSDNEQAEVATYFERPKGIEYSSLLSFSQYMQLPE